LGVVPDHARKLLQFLVDRATIVLVAVKDGAPLFFSLQVDKVLRVEESGGVVAVVGTPVWLTTSVTSGNDAITKRACGEAILAVGPSLGGSVLAPDRAFIQVRQEL